MDALVDPSLLAILQCPRCEAALREERDPPSLVCEAGHRYPVIDGIPDMVADD